MRTPRHMRHFYPFILGCRPTPSCQQGDAMHDFVICLRTMPCTLCTAKCMLERMRKHVGSQTVSTSMQVRHEYHIAHQEPIRAVMPGLA